MSANRVQSAAFSSVTVALVAVAAGVLLVLTPSGWTTHARANSPRFEVMGRYLSGLTDRTLATDAALGKQPHDWAQLAAAGRDGLAYLRSHDRPVVDLPAVDRPLKSAVSHWRAVWTDHAAARLDAATVAATTAARDEMRAAMQGLANA